MRTWGCGGGPARDGADITAGHEPTSPPAPNLVELQAERTETGYVIRSWVDYDLIAHVLQHHRRRDE